ncbi:hypothetical protein EJ110_NYTH35234 [Nymphaea thermarum]|nr:hypothetical protein EJ110_NYTH35234 [Nymphaea thermarum]
MAEFLGSPKNAGLDAGSASKAKNVPIQVTSIRLTKDNYLSWSAALEIGITSRGRLSYITGDKPAPLKSDPQWETWALEDSQVKGDLSVAAFYAALKTKWEELDYHVTDEWKCGSDHSLHWEKEWMDRTFLFLGGLRDEFEPIRSQILNGDEIPGNKLGHSADFCWDLHPEKRLVRGRPPSGRRSPSLSDSSQGTPSSGVKTTKLSPDQLKELQDLVTEQKIGIGSVSDGLYRLPVQVSPSVSATVSNEKDSQLEAMVRNENEMVSQMEGVTADARDHLFGQEKSWEITPMLIVQWCKAMKVEEDGVGDS